MRLTTLGPETSPSSIEGAASNDSGDGILASLEVPDGEQPTASTDSATLAATALIPFNELTVPSDGRRNAFHKARNQSMRVLKLWSTLCLTVACVPGLLGALELQAGTVNAWEEYIRGAESRIQTQADSTRPFLWIDESPERRAEVKRGEVVVAPVVGHGTKSVPDGLIHDWIGGVFIPNATIESLSRVLHDYNRYKEIYKPVVTDSRTLGCTDENQEFSMVWQRRVLFVNAAMEGQYRSRDVAIDAHHGYTVADATTVQEIEDYGHANQRLLPPDTGKGFIWRLHSIARYEEADGGAYLELEVIALTRDIPVSLAWLVNPVVNHLSMNSLTTTLRQTRQAVTRLPGKPEPVSMCKPRGRHIETTASVGE